MITANRTPELLSELISAFKVDGFYQGAVNRVANSMVSGKQLRGEHVDDDVSATSIEAGKAYVGTVMEYLPTSKIYYADPHMCEVIEMAAAVMDSTDLADVSTVVSDTGFCYFAQGITLTDELTIHGISWTRLADDIYFIGTYNDSYEAIDEMSLEMRRLVLEYRNVNITGRWTFGTLSQYEDKKPLIFTEYTSQEMQEMGYNLMGSDSILPSHIFHALMLLINQPPQVVTLSTAEMTHKKHLKRAKAAKVATKVTVIDMRHRYEAKPRATTTRDKAFEYSRRWLVSGHWRWQPMKDPSTKEWVKKRIWINPHTKGPENKPFITTKKVHALLK